MTRAVSAIGSILIIILAISSWHFAAKKVTQLKNLEKNREQKNYTYCANVHLLMHHADCTRVQLQCKLSDCKYFVREKKVADIEDDKSMTSLENTARQAVLKILRIWQISKENVFVNIIGISEQCC
jgi:hypothetical protein